MKKATHRKQALMIAIFLLAFTLSLFSFGTTPAAAGDVAGVSTHLFLTVLRDYDHDASFSVTYTDALGTHTTISPRLPSSSSDRMGLYQK